MLRWHAASRAGGAPSSTCVRSEYFGFKEQKPVELQREDEKEPGALRTSTSKESLLFREGIPPFTEFTDANGAKVNRSRLDIKVSLREWPPSLHPPPATPTHPRRSLQAARKTPRRCAPSGSTLSWV